MYIVHIASELAPIAKVGGLGDVVYGLSNQLIKNGHEVEVILPKYDCLIYEKLKKLKVEFRELWSYEGPYRFNNTIWSAESENLKVLFLEPHHPQYYFTRGTIYGCHDDNDRFVYFSRAVMEYLYKSGKRPDVIHCHDWPTALVPVLYREMYKSLGMHINGTLLTIHNLEHQGKCAQFNLSKAGLRGEDFLTPHKMQDPRSKNTINLLKGGIVYANAITTVSPTYEKEIKTPAEGCGLDPVLIHYSAKLKGILNGIDEDYWDPHKDPHLAKTYPSNKIHDILEAKAENRKHICTQAGFKEKKGPLVIAITRLVPQKGPDLIRHAILRTLSLGGQFVLLGSCSQPEILKPFLDIKKTHPQHDNLFLCLEHDEAFAHQLFAAADMIVIPSLFEPCGLTQMIALRYGTIPIVRSTGGLADTVFDIDNSSRPEKERNGFSFKPPNSEAMRATMERAFAYYEYPKKWHDLIQQGMHYDFSWAHTTPEYEALYTKLQ